MARNLARAPPRGDRNDAVAANLFVSAPLTREAPRAFPFARGVLRFPAMVKRAQSKLPGRRAAGPQRATRFFAISMKSVPNRRRPSRSPAYE